MVDMPKNYIRILETPRKTFIVEVIEDEVPQNTIFETKYERNALSVAKKLQSFGKCSGWTIIEFGSAGDFNEVEI